MKNININKDYLFYLFIAGAALILLIASYEFVFKSFKSSSGVIYVIDMKKVVDGIKRDYLVSSAKDLSNTSRYENLMKKRFKLLDLYLNNKDVVVYEKSAIVYYPKGAVIDLTPEIMKILEISDVK